MPHRILVVDDDELLRECVCITLRDAGYRAFDTGDGNAAVAIARIERPHAIFLDIVMPDFDGFAVLNVLRMDPLLRSIPVIMLTSVRQEAEVKRALGLGASGYVVKPIDAGQLVVRLKSVLKAQRQAIDNPVNGYEWLD